MINSGGIKIHPELVEKQIEVIFDYLKLNNRFFVSGIEDQKLGQMVVLVIEGERLSTDELNRTINQQLDKYERPREIIFIKQLSETASGKIDRRATLKVL